MTKHILTEEQLARLLAHAGEQWCQKHFPPLTEEEKARAYRAVDQALARIDAQRQPSTLERIATLLHAPVERLRSAGAMRAPGLVWTPRITHSDGEAPEAWSRTVRSDDDLVVGTLLVTKERDVWVSFETRDPSLSGDQVRFALVSTDDDHVFAEGHVTLEPAGDGLWEGRQRLDPQQISKIETTCELIFAVEEPQA